MPWPPSRRPDPVVLPREGPEPSRACLRRLPEQGWAVSVHGGQGMAQRDVCASIVDAVRLIDGAGVAEVRVWSEGTGTYQDVSRQSLRPLLEAAAGRRPIAR